MFGAVVVDAMRFGLLNLLAVIGFSVTLHCQVALGAETADIHARLTELQRQARYDDAIALAQKHVAERSQRDGAKHPENGRLLNRLAELHRLKGGIDDAEGVYQRVLIEFADLKAEDRDVVRTALGNLTLLHMSQGRLKSAEKYAELMERELRMASAAARKDVPAPDGEEQSASEETEPRADIGLGPVVGEDSDQSSSEQEPAAGRDLAALLAPPPEAEPPAERPPERPPERAAAQPPERRAERSLQPSATGKDTPSAQPALQASGDGSAKRVAKVRESARTPDVGAKSNAADADQQKPRGKTTKSDGLRLVSAQRTAPAGAAQTCGAPKVRASPAEGGRIELVVTSACRAGQDFDVIYGKLRFQHRLDGRGRANVAFDLFAGPAFKLAVKMTDGDPVEVVVPALDLSSMSKIAIVWSKPVNLDLHVFEYAAGFGKPGHVWQGANRTLSEVLGLVAAEKRAHGYFSSTSDGSGPGVHAEVFTLVRADKQRFGAIAFALDFASRGEKAEGKYCGEGVNASVPYTVYRFSGSGEPTVESGLIAALACGRQLDARMRYMSSAVGDMRLR